MNNQYFPLTVLLASSILLTIVACGGGSSNTNNRSNNELNWVQNTFEQESQFKDLCQIPRSGSDAQGNAFPDKPGSTLHENHYLRSWSNNTYLWYNEITDQNPESFNTTIEYFNVLKSQALSPSGNPKDRFHFTFNTAEWQQLTQSGQSAGYGAEWALISTTPPRKILVAYTEANTPATATDVNLQRGAEVLTIDGIDITTATEQENINAMNNALFPSTAGESHTFVIRDNGSSATRTVTMTSAIITSQPVRQVSTISTATGNVGYILFNSHISTAEEGLVNAINQLANTGVNDLVLDLRYNGGGLLAIASQLGYMIAGATSTNNKVFDDTKFNDKHTVTNPVTNQTLAPTPFYNQTLGFSVNAGQALPTLNLNRVFILSTDGTCSASEAIINGLRGVDIEVVLIGGTTCGKPYGFYPQDNCGTTYFTIQFKGENDQGFGDYSDGFSPVNTAGTVGVSTPGCSVADDFTQLLGNSQEAQLAAALNYRINQTCPIPTGKAAQKLSVNLTEGVQTINPNLAIKKPFKLNDKIQGLPKQ